MEEKKGVDFEAVKLEESPTFIQRKDKTGIISLPEHAYSWSSHRKHHSEPLYLNSCEVVRNRFERRRVWTASKQDSIDFPEDFQCPAEDNVFVGTKRLWQCQKDRPLYQRSSSAPSMPHLPDVVPEKNTSSANNSPDVLSDSCKKDLEHHHIKSILCPTLSAEMQENLEKKQSFEGSVCSEPTYVAKRKKSVTFESEVQMIRIMSPQGAQAISYFRNSSGYGSQSDNSQVSQGSNQSTGSVMSDDVLEEKRLEADETHSFSSTNIDGSIDDTGDDKTGKSHPLPQTETVADTQKSQKSSFQVSSSQSSTSYIQSPDEIIYDSVIWRKEMSPKVHCGNSDPTEDLPNLSIFGVDSLVNVTESIISERNDSPQPAHGAEQIVDDFKMENAMRGTVSEGETFENKTSPKSREDCQQELYQKLFEDKMLEFDPTKESIIDLLDWVKKNIGEALSPSPKSPFFLAGSSEDVRNISQGIVNILQDLQTISGGDNIVAQLADTTDGSPVQNNKAGNSQGFFLFTQPEPHVIPGSQPVPHVIPGNQSVPQHVIPSSQPVPHVIPGSQPVPHHVNPSDQPVPHRVNPCSQPAPHHANPSSQPVPHHVNPSNQPVPRVNPCSQPMPHHVNPSYQPVSHHVNPCSQPTPHQVTPSNQPVPHHVNPCIQPMPHHVNPCSQPVPHHINPSSQNHVQHTSQGLVWSLSQKQVPVQGAAACSQYYCNSQRPQPCVPHLSQMCQLEGAAAFEAPRLASCAYQKDVPAIVDEMMSSICVPSDQLSSGVGLSLLEQLINISHCTYARCTEPFCVQGRKSLCSLKEALKEGPSYLSEDNLQMMKLLVEHYNCCELPNCPVLLCRCINFRAQTRCEKKAQELITCLSEPLLTLLPYDTHLDEYVKLDSSLPGDKVPQEWVDWLTIYPLSYSFTVAKVMPLKNLWPQRQWVVKLTGLHEGRNQLDVYRKLRDLQHANIVNHIWVAAYTSEILVVCTDFVAGQSMREVLDQRMCLSPLLAFFYLQQILSATQHLHSLQIVFLNWTCSNILLDQSKHSVQLTNFTTSVDLSSQTHSADIGTVKLTLPADIVPSELLIQGGKLTVKSDSWGLACILHEMMTGVGPWPHLRHCSKEDTWLQILKQIPPEMKANLPPQVKSVIYHCLKRCPNSRMSVTEIMEQTQPQRS